MRKQSHQSHTHAAGDFTWEVSYPSKQASGFSQRKPTATIEVDERKLYVPVEVARRLEKYEKKASFPISSLAELVEVIDQAEHTCAWEKIISLVNRRDYTSFELEKRLHLRGYTEAVVHESVEKASKTHLVDDRRFGRLFVESKIRLGWGKRKIALELKKRGLVPEEIEGWPEAFFPEDDQYTHACQLLEHKTLRPPHRYQKAVRFLVGRGFSYGTAMRAAATAAENDSDSEL